MWYGVDQIDTSAPAGRYGNPRGFEYISWPRVQVRDVVEYKGKEYREVAYYVSLGVAELLVNQFNFYTIMAIEFTVCGRRRKTTQKEDASTPSGLAQTTSSLKRPTTA